VLGLLAAAFFGFGRHHGAHVAEPPTHVTPARDVGAFAYPFVVWWLMVLPFLQSRIAAGRWTLDYSLLFRHSWRNVIMLAEAALFTGIFWLILALWQMLFFMLGFGFFRRLFSEAAFVYPVTTLAFGCALYLIGSVETLLTGALEQLLNLLKWLACVAFVVLTTFTVALGLSLPELLSTGHHTIGAVWLLWLVAVVVLFLNAAYRDGRVSVPYPGWIAIALRACLPLATLVALTAVYCLIVRTRLEGLTVERMWALVVAGAALLYCAGYTVAALRTWMPASSSCPAGCVRTDCPPPGAAAAGAVSGRRRSQPRVLAQGPDRIPPRAHPRPGAARAGRGRPGALPGHPGRRRGVCRSRR
jgi:hypothetical protein